LRLVFFVVSVQTSPISEENKMPKTVELFESLTQGMQAVGRRNMIKRAGMLFGAGGVIATLATPARADDTDSDKNGIVGLWGVVVSAADNSFPAFPAFESWGGGGTWTGSGQPDLTPAALGSTGWGAWKLVKDGKFHMIGRFWTYSPAAVPTGFATLDFVYTLSGDGNHYRGTGPTQFFDTSGNPYAPPTPTIDTGTRIA
jgi:hypothetical protein